jgi:hypothetical protein
MKASRNHGDYNSTRADSSSWVDDVNASRRPRRFSTMPTIKFNQCHIRPFNSENTLSEPRNKYEDLATLAAIQLLDSCLTIPAEHITSDYGDASSHLALGVRPLPYMISTLSMHSMQLTYPSNAASRESRTSNYMRRSWHSIWRNGYDGPWSSASDPLEAKDIPEERSQQSTTRVSDTDTGPSTLTRGRSKYRLRYLKSRSKRRCRHTLRGFDSCPPELITERDTHGDELYSLSDVEDIDDPLEDSLDLERKHAQNSTGHGLGLMSCPELTATYKKQAVRLPQCR